MADTQLSKHKIWEVYINIVFKVVTVIIMIIGSITGYLMIERRNIENQQADLVIKIVSEKDMKARKDILNVLKEIHLPKNHSSDMKRLINAIETGINRTEAQIETIQALEKNEQQIIRQLGNLSPESEKFGNLNNQLQQIKDEKNMHEEELKQLPLISSLKLKQKKVKSVVAIVVGHKKSSPGAMNAKYNVTEYEFNEELAILVKNHLDELNIESTIVYRKTYRDLPNDINELNPSVTISLHGGAFNTKMSGSQASYYYESKEGKELAELIQTGIVDTLGLPDRGIKAKDSEDRGGYLLRFVNSPTVILEPFFIDNDTDFETARKKKDELASSIAQSIQRYKI